MAPALQRAGLLAAKCRLSFEAAQCAWHVAVGNNEIRVGFLSPEEEEEEEERN